MKKLFTTVLFFVVCCSAQGQLINCDFFDFDVTDTFYYYDFSFRANPEPLIDRIFIDTINYKHNQWQIGKPAKKIFNAAYSFPNSIVTDTLLSCLPNDTSVFILKLPDTGMPYENGLSTIAFAYQLNLDVGDTALLEASIDSGKTWKHLYTYSHSTTVTEWDSIYFYAGIWKPTFCDTVYLRFTLMTGSDTTARDGWIVDNIMAFHPWEDVADIKKSNSILIYPSPTARVAKLKFAKALNAECEMRVVDALGRETFRERLNKGSTDYTLSVQDWMKGIYFIELNDGKGNRTTQKLMVE